MQIIKRYSKNIQLTKQFYYFNANNKETGENKINHQIDSYKDKSVYDLPTAQQYITDQIRKFDWGTYVISNYYPSSVRNALQSYHYLNIELQKIPEQSKEMNLSLGKIEYWQDAINQIFLDSPIKEPVTIALHHACKNNPIPKNLLLTLLNTRRRECEQKQISNLSQLTELAEGIRTNLIYLNLSLLRINYKESPELQQCAILVGRCLGIIDYIKRIPYSLRKYRLFLPQELLQKHNVSVRTLWDRIDGKPKDELFDVVLEVAAFAKKCLDEAKQYQGQLPPQAFRAFLHAVEAEFFLQNLEKVNFDIFSKHMHSNSFIVLPIRVFNASKKKTFFLEK